MKTRSGLNAIRSLDYVILPCDDVDKMKYFYSDVMGFEIDGEEPGNWVELRVGTLYLGLRPRGCAHDGERIPETAAAVQISFRLPPADVDEAFKQLTQMGVDVIERPTSQDWAHHTLSLHDPECNAIEIFADIHPRETLAVPSEVHKQLESLHSLRRAR